MSDPGDSEMEVVGLRQDMNPVVGTASLGGSQASKCVVAQWDQLWSQDLLAERYVRDFWRTKVPLLCSPEPNSTSLDPFFDEATVTEQLLNPLELFMCAGKNPKETFEKLASEDTPPSLCGKIFKLGEPTYSCRDCGTDPTCVLCVDCFRVSNHRNHRYKMSTSVGGGYCDCGDKEAWESDPCCARHTPVAVDSGISSRQAALQRLEQMENGVDMVKRIRFIFQAVLHYSYELLTSNLDVTLPPDLEVKDSERMSSLFEAGQETPYCTVVYNDEQHTFEHVIEALHRALECTQRIALELATCIDREGRSVVRCSSYQTCDQVRILIERSTSRQHKPLRVVVMDSRVIAHQTFALRLLSWLQGLMGTCEGFRVILAESAMEAVHGETSMVEGVMLFDTQLWKSARTIWHRLFITGLLMDPDNKRAFAKLFVKHYGAVMRDFIADDHEHSHSVSSLSVQLFTVPTLAQQLIAEHDVLAILLQFFMIECEKRKGENGKLAFERSNSTASFRRAMYVLYDLKYLLSGPPPVTDPTTKAHSGVWVEELRKGFLHGFALLTSVLSLMQGMDASVRQTGQHLEYEPEWESAFNLHFKFVPVLGLFIRWAASDYVVLLKATRLILRKLEELQVPEMIWGNDIEFAGHKQRVLDYDVSSRPVSVHLPLTRLLAGLWLYLPKYGLSLLQPSLPMGNLTLEAIIEPALRVQVLIGQIEAGLWRRNGYGLLNQTYFYANVRCRPEMLDRDITLLQFSAAHMGPDAFLLCVLHRYGLIPWSKENFEQHIAAKIVDEDTVRSTLVLVQEFLRLVIILTSERYTCGIGQVTEDDCLMKEVIQQLCIEPMAHSALNRSLPEDAHHETGLDRVVNKVADFKKPQAPATGTTPRGVYVLRQEYEEQYNVFYYHYTREEQSRSEENQRKKRKARNEEDCCPPPPVVPFEAWAERLAGICNSDVLLAVLKLILERAANLRSRLFSEGQLQAALHLIGLGLREEEMRPKRQLAPFDFVAKAERTANILTLLEKLQTNGRVEAHRPLLNWTIRKYKQLLALTEGPGVTTARDAQPSMEDDKEAQEAIKKRKAAMAAARRAAILAQMSAQQKNFITQHKQLLDESESTEEGASMQVEASTPVAESLTPIALGPSQTKPDAEQQSYTCILCQEEQKPSYVGQGLVLAAFVQRSAVLKNRGSLQDRLPYVVPSTTAEVRQEEEEDHVNFPLLFSSKRPMGIYTSSCGHAMHAHCWQKYFLGLVSRERRRSYRPRHPSNYDVERREFLCPLCQSLSNAVVPVLPQPPRIAPDTAPNIDTGAARALWLEALSTAVGNHGKSETIKFSEVDQAILKRITRADEDKQVSIQDGVDEMVDLFGQAVYAFGLDKIYNSEEKEQIFGALAHSAAFTVASVDAVLAWENKAPLADLSLRQSEGLRSLLRFLCFVRGKLVASSVMEKAACKILGPLLAVVRSQEPYVGQYSILRVEPLALWMTLTLSVPTILEKSLASHPDEEEKLALCWKSNTLEAVFVFELALICHVTQVVLTLELAGYQQTSMDVEGADEEEASLKKKGKSWKSFLNTVWDIYRPADVPEIEKLDDLVLARRINESMVPFLRSVAQACRFLTSSTPPSLEWHSLEEQVPLLMRYLGSSEALEDLVLQHWAITLALRLAQSSKELAKQVSVDVKFPLQSSGLLPLPDDYSELINSVSMFTCPRSEGYDSRTPTLCLLCGEMLCSQSYCCQTRVDDKVIGACTSHAATCGLGIGVFLRVRECKVALLAPKYKGCFVPPPYLDEYGETDQGLRRGDPLHLCASSYRKLEQLWRSHGVHEEVARQMEASQSQALVVAEWFHL